MSKKIHVVAFQNPFPADYGGVIDVYFRLRELRRRGVFVVLHTFVYADRKTRAEDLAEVADEVYFYPRHTGLRSWFSRLPYIVNSRRSNNLIDRLLADNAPVLFEGLHCCAQIGEPRLASRTKILRAHNVEHDYYSGLAKSERNPFKKFYFKTEARRLKRFEPRAVAHADTVLAISSSDADHFKKLYPEKTVLEIPCFFDADARNSQTSEQKRFVLYHANLSVAENISAALRIINDITTRLSEIPFVIAGKNPDPAILKAAASAPNVRIVSNPDDKQMESLVSSAAVTLLLTSQATGIKIKLLTTLVSGRHIIANEPMLRGTSLHSYCTVADTDADIIEAVKRLIDKPFEGRMLPSDYSPSDLAAKIIGIAFPNSRTSDS